MKATAAPTASLERRRLPLALANFPYVILASASGASLGLLTSPAPGCSQPSYVSNSATPTPLTSQCFGRSKSDCLSVFLKEIR